MTSNNQMLGGFPRGNWRPLFQEPKLSDEEQDLVDRFSDLYYSKLDQGRGLHTIVLSWFGYEMFKCPMDLWIYQELITWSRPDVIIEVGTYKGGSALFLAHMMDINNLGRIVSIDIDDSHADIRPQHERIQYIKGSSTDESVFEQVKFICADAVNPLVILDGDHTRDQVLKELNFYNGLIKVGGYLIVEDTNINGHPTYTDFGPGPWEAVDAFMADRQDFVVDRTCERFLLTMNPRGFLKRIAPAS